MARPLFVIGYAFYPFILGIYVLEATPAMLFLVLSACEVLRRWSRAVGGVACLAVAALCLTSFHELNPGVHDADFASPTLVQIDAVMGEIKEPAIVLFRFADGCSPSEEPVYNIDVAWPDDALVIRAHDLGPRNIELFDYYAKIAPGRVVYRLDRGNGRFDRLGTVGELAGKPAPG